jgi:hypothetical protein
MSSPVALALRFPIEEALNRSFHSIPEAHSSPYPPTSICGLSVEILGDIASYLPYRDVLNLVSTNTTMRVKVLAVFDWKVKEDIDINSPWMLPHGDDELKVWTERVDELGGKEALFPWFVYRWACAEHSPSMLNRKRIWSILKQMEGFAKEAGIL